MHTHLKFRWGRRQEWGPSGTSAPQTDCSNSNKMLLWCPLDTHWGILTQSHGTCFLQLNKWLHTSRYPSASPAIGVHAHFQCPCFKSLFWHSFQMMVFPQIFLRHHEIVRVKCCIITNETANKRSFSENFWGETWAELSLLLCVTGGHSWERPKGRAAEA